MRVAEDFDRIAREIEAAGLADTLQPMDRWLLDRLPASCGDVLEVGCGHGALTRHLARRARSVVALDLSPEMIRIASAKSGGPSNIDFRVADVTATDLPPASFDTVVSVAALHHVPLGPTIARLAAALRPGGCLLVQDIVDRGSARYLLRNALAWLERHRRRMRGAREITSNRAVTALYREHGQHERYLTPAEAEQVYAALLPGCRVIHHLEWRYTVVWTRSVAERVPDVEGTAVAR